ncbi:MAG: hypothetical protein GYA55_10785 [SAR324 cluster bacterium]|uniref:DUF5660 domain-containing protein n=1 Tax=SAR324 cluster bacterium TaxID=2024889 RepID=A0A7X9FSS1_9DELT|nr:hypothetical protein [SAR324 cluster bacterium]
MADNKKTKGSIVKRNVVESLKDIGDNFGDQSSDLLKSTSEDFLRELLGIRQAVKRSAEMKPGESLDMKAVASGQDEENKRLRNQISFERNLASEERSVSENKMNILRSQLQSITVEISNLAASTGNFATQTEIAMIEVPQNPGVYHIIFFENVLRFLQSFRQKIDQASIWLESTNKRAEKKNYWSMYKKKGSSFLLSPDHYSQRSAG